MDQQPAIHELIGLHGKTALVTGGAQGIGLAIASRLHEAGANVALIDSNYNAVHAAADSLSARRPGSIYACNTDVSKSDEVSTSIHTVREHFGGIDILVNNAGIFPVQPLAHMTEADFMRVIATNTLSVFLYCQQVSEVMKADHCRGVIINVTSIDALHPSMVGLAHYDASKHGVWGFTKNIARELAEFGIRVNALAPGGVATPGVAALSAHAPSVDPAELAKSQEAFLSRIPMHRMGESDEIARAALFLASDLSSYMTGSQVVVDGGALLM